MGMDMNMNGKNEYSDANDSAYADKYEYSKDGQESYEKHTQNRLLEIAKQLNEFNEDELFYRDYYEAGKNSENLRKFLGAVDLKDAIRRHLVIPELLPEIISYEMDDSEYFEDGSNKNVIISKHNRYTPAFLHRHDFFEIVFVYSGQCEQTIGLDRKKFSAGDLIFVAPGVYHTMEVFDDESIILNILLRKGTFYQVFGSLMHGHSLIGEFFSGGLYKSEQIRYLVFHKGTRELRSAQGRALVLYLEQMNRDPFSDQMMIGLVITFIAKTMRDDMDVMESSYSDNKSAGKDDLRIMRYIQNHLADVTLADTADHFGFSVSYCSRLIKSATGQNFNDWKRTLRVRKAEEILKGTRMPIAEIGAELGFENPESFIRAFKKECGMTPAKYRKQMAESRVNKT